ncbi:MAG: hypothetical protein KDA61_09975 [Planctomycetales bacterium]|nr:hypothetical protein [Planctomycetales bacterium]
MTRAARVKNRPSAMGVALLGCFLAAWPSVAAQGQPPQVPDIGPPASDPMAMGPMAPGRMTTGMDSRGLRHITLPPENQSVNAYSSRSGLFADLAVFATGAYGYRDVVVSFERANASPSAQQITVRLRAGSHAAAGANISVEVDGEIPANGLQTDVHVAVPMYQDWQIWSLDVWIDGLLDPELSFSQYGVGFQQAPGEAGLTMWISENRSPPKALAGILASATHQASPGELSDQWILYTPYDAVACRIDDLEQLAKKRPNAFAAIARWVRTGGNLITFAVPGESAAYVSERLRSRSASDSSQNDGDYALQRRIDRLLQADATSEPIASRPWIRLYRSDRPADPIETALLLAGIDEPIAASELVDPPGNFNSASPAQEGEMLPRRPVATFWTQRLGFGLVAAVDTTGYQPNSLRSEIRRSPLGQRLEWSQRHGFAPDRGTVEFNNWLIPGVGVAPVGMFQFLSTVFVLAIGPLNYWWFYRRRKLPMLLVTVPTGAAAVTALLFVYGVFGDGFDLQTRVRSVTILDQPAGEAAGWARMSYYAPVSLDEGLALPSDVAVYPLEFGTRRNRRGNQLSSKRELFWDDRQRLSRGWLRPRTPTQMLQIWARPVAARLEIRPLDDKLQVTNRLGVNLLQTAIEDDQKRIFYIRELPDGASQTVVATESAEWMMELRETLLDNAPAYPDGAQSPLMAGGYYNGPLLSNSLMETVAGAVQSPLARRIGARSYAAVASERFQVELGADDADEQASFHLIYGVW